MYMRRFLHTARRSSQPALPSLAPRSALVEPSDLAALAALVQSAERLLLLTGAGLSTTSGIPDYRSPNGSYSKGHVPIQHREFVSDQSKRRRYWARSYVGYGYFSRARPNAAHFAVSALQERGLLRGGIITQNVDGLHSAAGASGVLDLHGRIDEVECLNCGALTPRAALQERLAGLNAGWLERAGVAAVAQAAMRADGDAALSDEACASFVVPECGACGGGPLKPTVTFFGGTVPPAIVEASKAAAAAADAVLVAGSSVATFSAFRLVKRVAEDRKPVAVLNIGPSRADPLASLAVSADVATVLPTLVGGLYGQQAEAEVWRSAAAARSRAEMSANK